MSLSDLPARELARLDAVCLDYELRLRDSHHLPSPSDVETAATADATTDIEALVQRHGGEHAELLRAELEAIRSEVSNMEPPSSIPHPSSLLDHPSSLDTSSESSTNASLRDAMTEVLVDEKTGALGDAASPAGRSSKPDSKSKDGGLPPIGTEIGPYLLTSVLGRGGMGIVYRATDTRLDRSVAIKMLSVRGNQSDSLNERFQREAKAVAGLTHPHIVELFDVGIFEGLPYAVMEHLRGNTLASYLRSRKRKSAPPLPTEQVRRWGLQLADALSIAHENGVIHRDIKPENMMLLDRPSQGSHSEASQGQSTARASKSTSKQVDGVDVSTLKLFDFGLSRIGTTQWSGSEQFTQLEVPSGLPEMEVIPTGQSMSDLIAEEKKRKAAVVSNDSSTRVGMILGTPGYMAPEQARGDVVTTATDIFALGCVLYEAMFGRPAFEGDSPAKRFAAVLEKQPLPDPVRRRDDVELTNLILSMLTKDPAGRPLAVDLVEALQKDSPSYSTHATGARSSNQNRQPEPGDGVFLSRRRLFQLGFAGTGAAALGIGLSRNSPNVALHNIHSIGVLSFQEVGSDAQTPPVTPRPGGGSYVFEPGEMLAGLLVNELSRLDGIMVPKFVPMTASLPSEFQKAAELLEVDAIVTGTYSTSQGAVSQRIMTVNLEIVSGETGKLIEGGGLTVPTSAGENLIEQSVLARELAERIGRELTEGDETKKAKQSAAFTCLIKGRVRSDPDSVEGMEMALLCFKHAANTDENYAPAFSGLGLTSITLAAQSSDAKAGQLIAQAQQATSRALELENDNVEALLARSMLDYQILTDFDAAEEQLSQLAQSHPNHWQVQHQAGWIKMIQFKEAAGLQLLRRATGLHPASRYLKADLARADWFRGYPDRAIQAALAMLDPDLDESLAIHAKGLLIDLYEQSENYKAAAEIDPQLSWRPGDEPNGYFAAREARLSALPYGPFGESINATILQVRRNDVSNPEPAESMLARLIAAQLPMLPLVVCKHPAMASMTVLEQAVETFSVLKIG